MNVFFRFVREKPFREFSFSELLLSPSGSFSFWNNKPNNRVTLKIQFHWSYWSRERTKNLYCQNNNWNIYFITLKIENTYLLYLLPLYCLVSQLLVLEECLQKLHHLIHMLLISLVSWQLEINKSNKKLLTSWNLKRYIEYYSHLTYIQNIPRRLNQ